MAITMRVRKSRFILHWLFGTCLLFPVHAQGQSYQSQVPVIKKLTVAAWSVPLESQTKARQKQTASQSGWRNTFGRERKTAQWRKLGTASVDADIVILKNLKSLQDIRRIFPARTHQVIASRAALANVNRLTESATGQLEKKQSITYATFPAVAVRRRRGLRVTTVRHLSVKVNATESGQDQYANLYTGLATRIRVSGRFIWILTAVTKGKCKATLCDPDKLSQQSIEQWLKQTSAGYTSILLATAARSSGKSDQDPKDGQQLKDDGNSELKCAHAAPPRIEAARQSTDRRIRLGPSKAAADRPCATITTLHFQD